jgi:hypothetical protein
MNEYRGFSRSRNYNYSESRCLELTHWLQCPGNAPRLGVAAYEPRTPSRLVMLLLSAKPSWGWSQWSEANCGQNSARAEVHSLDCLLSHARKAIRPKVQCGTRHVRLLRARHCRLPQQVGSDVSWKFPALSYNRVLPHPVLYIVFLFIQFTSFRGITVPAVLGEEYEWWSVRKGRW